jgi:DNA polymerase-1
MQLRNFAERTALNSPLQGTAADLIKLAMIHIDRRLSQEKFEAKMILQVHDELLFEAPEHEVEQASEIVEREMAGAFELDPPLGVDVGVGPNWMEAK